MGTIKLDPNKAYRVNFRFLEAAEPSAVRIGIGEKPASTPPPPPGPGPSTCVTKAVDFRNIITNDFYPAGSFGNYLTTAHSKLKWSMLVGQILSVKIPKNLRIYDRDIVILRFSVFWSQSGIMPQGANPDDYEACLSECEGDFTSVIPGNTRSKVYFRHGLDTGLLDATYDSSVLSPAQRATYAVLNRNKDYYLNIRINRVGFDSSYPPNLGSLGLNIIHLSRDQTGIGPPALPVTCTPGPVSGIADYAGQSGGVFYAMPRGQIQSIRLDTSRYMGATKTINFQISEAPTTPMADILASISLCPGDFNPPYGACRFHSGGTGGVLTVAYDRPLGSRESLSTVCKLPAAPYIYFNFKQVLISNPSQPSCVITVPDPDNFGCGVKVAIQPL